MATNKLIIQDVNGRIGIGTTDPADRLHITTGNVIIGANVSAGFVGAPLKISGTAIDVGMQLVQASDNIGAPRFFLSKARGTLSSPTTILTNDQTGSLRFTGYVGSTGGYVQNALFSVEAEGTVSDTSTGLGGRMTFSTRTPGGSVTERVRIDSNGRFLVGYTSVPNIGTDFKILADGLAVGVSGSYTYGVYGGSSGNLVLTTNAYPANLGVDTYVAIRGGSSGGGGPNDIAIFKTNGRVGIGTTDPQNILQISGTNQSVRFTNAGIEPAGLIISYLNNNDHGLHLTYKPNDATANIDNTYPSSPSYIYGDIYFRQNIGGTMTTRLSIKADGGHVGIGMTNPGNFNSLSFGDNILDVNGIIQVRGDATNNLAAVQFGGDTYRKAVIYSSVGTFDPYLAFGVAPSGSASAASERMRITKDGYVGIATTDAQSASLRIVRASESANVNFLKLDMSGWSNSIGFLKNITWGDPIAVGAIGMEYAGDGGATTSMHFHSFYNSGYTSSILMSIRGSGNVGIGTTKPASKLQISDSSSPHLRLHFSGSASSGNKGILYFTHNRNSDSTQELLGYIQGVAEDNQSTGGIRFVSRNNTDVEVFKITAAGTLQMSNLLNLNANHVRLGYNNNGGTGYGGRGYYMLAANNFYGGSGIVALQTNITHNVGSMIAIKVAGYNYGSPGPFEYMMGCYSGENGIYNSYYSCYPTDYFSQVKVFRRNSDSKLMFLFGAFNSNHSTAGIVAERYIHGFYGQDDTFATGWQLLLIPDTTGYTELSTMSRVDH